VSTRPFLVIAATLAACGGPSAPASSSLSSSSSSSSSSFADDVAFLSKHGKVHVLEGNGGARIALSGKYQARVMTSAVEESGRSFGWINRAFVEAGKTGTHFDNYGGEDRFWLGPEAGQYGLYFAPGAPFELSGWQVPSQLQEGEWDLVESSTKRAAFRRAITVKNWSGKDFSMIVDRTVEMLDVPLPSGVKAVAYQSVNRITNTGGAAWTKESGLLSVWVLGQYASSSDMHVIVPFANDPSGTPIVNDEYFGKVPKDRLSVREDKGFLLFKADGAHRSKIGLGPHRAKPVFGSYSPQARLLTVVRYDKPEGEAPYVNSMWEKQAQPYAGDVINSYNDGPPEPGKPALGGFYELETSSPGAELAPQKSLVHTVRTYHFVGDAAQLESLSKSMLGVALSDVTGR
jgi:hypothetical protein